MIPAGWSYAWQNGAHPWLVAGHHAVDALRTGRAPLIESRADPGVVLAYAGLPDGNRHILPFLEQRRGGQAHHRRRTVRWSDLFSGRATATADLAAVGLPTRRTLPPGTPRSLVLPLRVTLVVPVRDGAEAVLRAVSRKARQQHVRELASRGRSLELATGEADFDSFYDDMHVPTMDNRHGAATRSMPKEAARRCLFRCGRLFFLREEDRRVAGLLCRTEGETLVVRLAGVADGGPEPYRHGTYMSLYILVLQWAAGQGLARVDLSGCEPFLSKGILQFKRKLHPTVRLPANHFAGKRLWLHVRRDTAAVRDFLVDNPPLTVEPDGTLRALYFHDRQRPARTDLRWASPGIAGARLADLDAFLTGEPASVWAGPDPAVPR
ncbi:GNAT family N-acetyltransferase [Micromonospora zhanjiangensis]|uniref:GNAT family N-acetyltransferase n=1 Tax=Micromonospora zhanjiangensis TaxID=1522057 RepID=A0ABV8KVQ2_9ACTN